MATTRHPSRQQAVVVPSGRPLFALKPSLTSEPAPAPAPSESDGDVADNLMEAMASGADSGLIDSSEALSSAIGGQGLAKPSTPANTKPYSPADFTDDDLIAWAKENRARHTHGHLTQEALRYWLRYTFDPYTPEYRELRDRFVALVK